MNLCTDTAAPKQRLLNRLRAQREHVLACLDGLEAEQLLRPVLPSGWNCLQLVHHLAIDDERFWFRGVMAGDPGVIAAVGAGEGDAWRLPAGRSAAEVVDLYHRECDLADAVIVQLALGTPPAWWPEDLFGDFRMADLAEVLLHVIAETATHAGHLDAVRELIDGRQHLVLG